MKRVTNTNFHFISCWNFSCRSIIIKFRNIYQPIKKIAFLGNINSIRVELLFLFNSDGWPRLKRPLSRIYRREYIAGQRCNVGATSGENIVQGSCVSRRTMHRETGASKRLLLLFPFAVYFIDSHLSQGASNRSFDLSAPHVLASWKVRCISTSFTKRDTTFRSAVVLIIPRNFANEE